ncbi:hypothetical protein, partial [Caballeronia grimmiae]|uniref:hypothetical protein n=1 Tax=Caballeronia grimmiae TaxID=1071679 RepID=UPI0038BC0FB4
KIRQVTLAEFVDNRMVFRTQYIIGAAHWILPRVRFSARLVTGPTGFSGAPALVVQRHTSNEGDTVRNLRADSYGYLLNRPVSCWHPIKPSILLDVEASVSNPDRSGYPFRSA